MKSQLLLILMVVVLLGVLCSPRAVFAQESKNEDSYKQAQALANAGKLVEAEVAVNKMLSEANGQAGEILMFRGSLRAEMGRFQDAAHDLARVTQLNPSSHWPWFFLAPLLVESRNLEKYRSNCKEMLSRFGDTTDAPVANRVAKSCLLVPSALDPQDVIIAEELADKSVALSKEGQFWPWRSMTQGLAEYRRSKFAHANELISLFQKQMSDAERSGALSGDWSTCKADAFFIAALAHHQLKETDRAKAELDQGRELVRTKLPGLDAKDLGSAWWDVLWTNILMSEASATVGTSTP